MMADVHAQYKAFQNGTAACAECGEPLLVATAVTEKEVVVTLSSRDGRESVSGSFTPKQLYEFAEASALVLVKQGEAIRARES